MKYIDDKVYTKYIQSPPPKILWKNPTLTSNYASKLYKCDSLLSIYTTKTHPHTSPLLVQTQISPPPPHTYNKTCTLQMQHNGNAQKATQNSHEYINSRNIIYYS